MSAFIRRRYAKPDGSGQRRFLGFEVEGQDAAGKRTRKLFKKRKDATNHRDALNAPKAPGKTRPAGTQTVEQAGRDWIARVKAAGRARVTWKKYEQRLEDHIIPVMVSPAEGVAPVRFGDMKIVEVSTPIVLRFKAALQKTEASPKLVARVMGCVRMLFNDAELAGEVEHNAARAVRAKKGEKPVTPPVEIPDPSQVRLLLAALRPTDEPVTLGQVWVPMMPATGMRPGELRALFWNYLFLEAREPFVRVAFAADEQGVIGTPKSQAGYRDIPLPRGLVSLLVRWREVCPPSPAFKDKGGLVFPTSAGHVQSYSNLTSRVFRPLMFAVGLTRPTGERDEKGDPVIGTAFTPYALRHFYASYLIQERDKNPKQVQRLMGHENIELTLQTYGHLWKDQQDDAALAESLGNFLEPTKNDLERVQLRLAKTA